MRKFFFKKVQTTGFDPNGYVNEERRVIFLKHEFIRRKGCKNSIPMWFNISKR